MTDTNSFQPPDGPIDVLLIEDNPGDIRLIQEAFKATDSISSPHPTKNGEHGLEFLREQASEPSASLPDLVLLDLNLPGKDGHEVLETIRTNERLSSLPVIILTSSENEEDIKRCYDANANAYLTKPDSPTEFEALANAVEEFWFDRVHLPPVPL